MAKKIFSVIKDTVQDAEANLFENKDPSLSGRNRDKSTTRPSKTTNVVGVRGLLNTSPNVSIYNPE
jgi:hypothetical protein